MLSVKNRWSIDRRTFIKCCNFLHTMAIELKTSAPASFSSDGFYADLIAYVKNNRPSKEAFHKYKIQASKAFGIGKPPTDIDVLMRVPPEDLRLLKQFLITKPVRSQSGVSVVAVMSEPRGCPHGKCTYCPGGPQSVFGDTPMSYTGHEPSSMRGRRNDYHSYRIVFNRLEHYVATGHHPDKCDVIIMGGTFPSYEREYRESFVHGIFAALNDFSAEFYPGGTLAIERFREFFELPGSLRDEARIERVKQRVLALYERSKHKSLAELFAENQTAVCRCIGLTQETKPDWGLLDHGNEMLRLGTTRVEVGVQTLFDAVLKSVNRGHDLEDTVQCFKILKDLGFKINAHMMLGLPGVTPAMDEESLHGLFDDERFRPDMVKIYPTLVMKGTALHYHWKKGTYVPMAADVCVKIIGDFFGYVPRYCRVMRVQRDIPSTVSDAGVQKTNLRQDVDDYLRANAIAAQEIRSREIRDGPITDPQMRIIEYDASGGKEFFISIDDVPSDRIIGFVRLRFPSSVLRPEITQDSALIRELHVYGSAVPIGEMGEVQHRGFGKQLMAKAEEIARAAGKDKMLVISGVGVRQYYETIGYTLEGPYMVKFLS